jgi:hypothetical protein
MSKIEVILFITNIVTLGTSLVFYKKLNDKNKDIKYIDLHGDKEA